MSCLIAKAKSCPAFTTTSYSKAKRSIMCTIGGVEVKFCTWRTLGCVIGQMRSSSDVRGHSTLTPTLDGCNIVDGSKERNQALMKENIILRDMALSFPKLEPRVSSMLSNRSGYPSSGSGYNQPFMKMQPVRLANIPPILHSWSFKS